MSDWPTVGVVENYAGGVISTGSIFRSLFQTTAAGAAWSAANDAIFIPFRLAVPVIVYKLAIGTGTGAGGNFDIGICDSAGNKLVSSGATARSASVEIISDIADTVIGPGVYYLAMSADGTNNYVMVTPSGTSPVPLQKTRLCGVLRQSTAYTLPATATYAAATTAPFPAIAAYLRPY